MEQGAVRNAAEKIYPAIQEAVLARRMKNC